MSFALAWLLTAALATLTVAVHGAALGLISAVALRDRAGPGGLGPGAVGIALVVLALLAAHTVEVWIYAGSMYLASPGFGVARLHGPTFPGGLRACLYASAVNCTSLGYGDISPTGEMRLVATLEALVSLLMIAWSSGFMFLLMERHRSDTAHR